MKLFTTDPLNFSTRERMQQSAMYDLCVGMRQVSQEFVPSAANLRGVPRHEGPVAAQHRWDCVPRKHLRHGFQTDKESDNYMEN